VLGYPNPKELPVKSAVEVRPLEVRALLEVAGEEVEDDLDLVVGLLAVHGLVVQALYPSKWKRGPPNLQDSPRTPALSLRLTGWYVLGPGGGTMDRHNGFVHHFAAVFAALVLAPSSCAGGEKPAHGPRERGIQEEEPPLPAEPSTERPLGAEDARGATTTLVPPEEDSAPALTEDPAADPVLLRLMRSTRRGFAALDVGPYRVIVEGTEARARSVAERTVRPVTENLALQFFEKGPRRGVRLVLFMSDPVYRAGAKALSGDPPDTPFGYYSPELRAVVMNLSTGGGTLVHEMVHTFVEVDFPDCPTWLNEGLGSLYEQCRFAPGRLVGLTNWRLPALQDVLREGRTGLVPRVVATSTEGFYGEGSGLHYAVARYLCYDLQQRGILERFYKELRRDHAADPTGKRTLERLLGMTLGEYEPLWRERTLRLRFPSRPAPRRSPRPAHAR
jgi:hypothetical protein